MQSAKADIRVVSRPRMMRHWRARERPCSSHLRADDLRWGTTRVRMGMVGRYLATRLAVRPELAYTMISPACTSAYTPLSVSVRHWLIGFCGNICAPLCQSFAMWGVDDMATHDVCGAACMPVLSRSSRSVSLCLMLNANEIGQPTL